MADNALWMKKSEALKDLGIRNTDAEDLITIRDKPPAVIFKEELDEMLELNFGSAPKENGLCQESVAPDLNSITLMLQQVRETEGLPDCSVANIKERGNDIIVISKLNPSVKEFVPKSLSTSSGTSTNTKSSSEETKPGVNMCKGKTDAEHPDTLSDKPDTKSDNTTACVKNKHIDLTKKIDVNDLKTEEIDEMVEVLKSKINNPSPPTLKGKMEKNVAMASLMKLYSAKAVPPVKLLKPEHFVLSTPAAKDAHMEIIQDENKDNKENHSLPTPSITTKAPKIEANPKEIEESIKKVDDWFKGPKETNKPVLHLGPVMFTKKKVSNSPETLKSVSTRSNTSSPVTAVAPKQFKPSNRAQELYNKFVEQSESKKHESEDIWAKAQREMKEKEKKQLEKRQNGCSSSSLSSPSTNTSE